MGRTVVDINGEDFSISGKLTYEGCHYRGMRIEGLLMNARLVQGIFDDLNPNTRDMWRYPDGPWDADRNTREFVRAMPRWRAHGLLGFTVNLQGGNPRGYGRDQPWNNSAFTVSGELRMAYMDRLERILEKADTLGMVPIVGFFYFGQDERLQDEAAVIRATESATDWLLEHAYQHVLVEIANEVDVPRYEHAILSADRCHELVELVQARSRNRVSNRAGRLLVSASTRGGALPPAKLTSVADFVLLHGNGVKESDRIRRMVQACRQMPEYWGQPMLFNEDDHFGFDEPENNMLAAVSEHAGWGYFDYRMEGEGYKQGFQSVPVDWGISSPRKRGFFALLSEMTRSHKSNSH